MNNGVQRFARAYIQHKVYRDSWAKKPTALIMTIIIICEEIRKRRC